MARQAGLLKVAAGVSVVLTLLVVGVVLAATVTVDTFDASDISLVANSSDPLKSGFYDGGGILGGGHEVTLTHVLGARVRIAIDYSSSDLLAYSQDQGGGGYATVRWDGDEEGEEQAGENNLALGGADLTGGGTNDSFRLRIVSNDQPVGLTIMFFETLANFDSFTFNTPGSILVGNPVDFVIPFSSFTATGSGGVESSAEAVHLEINGIVNADADISIDHFEASKRRDFGDLPTTGSPSYTVVTLAQGGACHIPQGLRLGAKVDAEGDGQPNASATGDDGADASDEDGVVRDMGDLWANGATVDLSVTINGCSSPPCRLNGWIDWNNDGDFNDTSEQVFTDQSISNGANQTLQITVPGSGVYTVGTDVYARFRLCASTSTCSSTAGEVTNGEVEDYFWAFSPTAVTLAHLNARASSGVPVSAAAALVLIASGVVVGGVLVLRRRAR